MPTATFTEINFDVDEYLSKGGRLRDLALPSGTELKTIERLAKSEASGLREQNDREYFEAHIRPLLDSPDMSSSARSAMPKNQLFSASPSLCSRPLIGRLSEKTTSRRRTCYGPSRRPGLVGGHASNAIDVTSGSLS